MSQPDLSQPEFSVVVPVRDEAGNIAPLLAEIHAALRGRTYEIIYVDDGSTDATASELAALATDKTLRVLRHDRSYGQSQALITGAAAARGQWIISLDGDGQNDPADFAALISARDAAGAGAVRTLYIGRRGHRRDNWSRRMASCVAYYARHLMLGDPTPDSGCGLRLIRRDLVLALPRFDALHRFMAVLVIRAGGGCGVHSRQPPAPPAGAVQIRHLAAGRPRGFGPFRGPLAHGSPQPAATTPRKSLKF